MKSIRLVILFCSIHAMANSQTLPASSDAFNDFKNLLLEVEKIRQERLVSLDSFLVMSKDPKTIILDARSDFRFERKHLAHALHLAFTDFTQSNLKQLIPDFNTRVLIYCNNNFTGDQVDFIAKKEELENFDKNEFDAHAKPALLALNIPTFITLFGYGYRNVYELNEVVDVNDPRIEFEGSVVNSPARRKK